MININIIFNDKRDRFFRKEFFLNQDFYFRIEVFNSKFFFKNSDEWKIFLEDSFSTSIPRH